MEPTDNVMTAGGAGASPFRRPPQPKPIPADGSGRSSAPPPARRPVASTAPILTTAPARSPAIAPGLTAATVEQQQLERRRRLGARWFYWIAAISLVNAGVALAGQHWRFIIGLGTTQVATALAARSGRGWAPAILLDLVLIAGFVLLGYLALQGQRWVFPVGIGLYALDGLIFLAARHWIGLGFHVFVLVMICKGLQAARQLDARGGTSAPERFHQAGVTPTSATMRSTNSERAVPSGTGELPSQARQEPMITPADLPSIVAAAMPRDLHLRNDLGEPGWMFWELRTLNRHRVVGLVNPYRQFADAHDLAAEIRGVVARNFKRSWWRGMAYGVVADVAAISLTPDDLKMLVDIRENSRGDLQWVILVASHAHSALGAHTWIEGYLSPVYRGTLQALAATGYTIASATREKDGLMKFLTGVADLNITLRSLGTRTEAFPEFRDPS